MWNNLSKSLFVFSLALFLAGIGSLASAQELPAFLADDTEYLWPTDASPYLSSTFAETRSAHFHAGLDIKTWGAEGYRVFATRDGLLFRLAVGPHGYGKVIYLQHNDGSYSVYAHLNRFAPFIQSIADSIRMENYHFEMDNLVGEKGVRVSRGEIIGYTGSTGIGPPHLHFELRTPDNVPFNPLLTNLSVVDQMPPVFSSLAVEHFNSVSYHTERIDTHARTRLADGIYDFGTIRADGPVGLAVDVYDRADNTTNSYAVYTLTLVQGADTLFSSSVNSFSYDDTSQMFIDRSYPLLAEYGRGYQRLFVVNGNTLPFYARLENRGVIDLPAGSYPVKITATDFYGNESIAELTLLIEDRVSPVTTAPVQIPAYPARSLTDRNPQENTFSYRASRGKVDPAYLVETASSGSPSGYTRLTVEPTLQLTRGDQLRKVEKQLIPGKTQQLNLPDQSFRMHFPENALFDTLSLQASFEIEGQRPVIRFSHEPVPLRNNVVVNMVLPDLFNDTDGSEFFDGAEGKAGLYSWDRYRNRYTFLAAANGRYLSAETGILRTLVVMTDDLPPTTGVPRIRTNLGGNPVVTLPVRDDLSGIDYRRSSITVNGEKGITEYNPDDNELIFYLPGFVPEAVNDVEFIVYDRSGNVTERRVSLPMNL